MTNEGVAAELPRYRCHKEVWALKIKAIDLAPKPTIAELEAILADENVPVEILPDGQISSVDCAGATITPEDERYAPFTVDKRYLAKHNPQVGGYYVVYADGYKSFSPAAAFEEGYTRI